MKSTSIRAIAGSLLGTLASFTVAADEEIDRIVAYRQSVMTLVGANFGPLAGMAKGEIPWNPTAAARFSADLRSVLGLDVLRGFAPGSGAGKTRARPEIWNNFDDFSARLDELRQGVDPLAAAAAAGDEAATMKALQVVGKSCKGCHDEYKSKDLLN